MKNIEKEMKRDLYIELFIDKFFYTAGTDMYKINDYNLFLSKTAKKTIKGLPDARTIEPHLKVICERLDQWEEYKEKKSCNPLLNLGTKVFKNPKEKFFFFRLCTFLGVNKSSDLIDHEITPIFFPLYVALIASYSKQYSTFEKYKEIVLERSEAIRKLMCTSKDAIECKKNEELYEDIPIGEIYEYALNYYFPTAMDSYFDTLENHSLHPAFEEADKQNVTALQNLLFPTHSIAYRTGHELLTQYLSLSVKLCPSPSVDTPLASYMHGSDYINAELIANNFYGANEMIYQLEQVLRHKLKDEIDIEKITMEQLGEKIDILISETC